MRKTHTTGTLVPKGDLFFKPSLFQNKSWRIRKKKKKHSQFIHTKHSQERAGQRCITDELLTWVLTYGTPTNRQGVTFFTVFSKDLPNDLAPTIRQKIKNLVVLIAADGRKIITCYRAKNAVKYLKKKRKYISKY